MLRFCPPVPRGKTTGRLIPILWMQVESVASSEPAASPPYDDELLITRATCRSSRGIGLLGTPDDVANVAGYLPGDLAAFVSGQRRLVPAVHRPDLRTSGIQEIF